jgi:uncharacterized phage-associated protein
LFKALEFKRLNSVVKKTLAVANWFILKGIDVGHPKTQMEIHKLVFFTQALSLASTDNEIFSSDFEAWEYGPVCPDLYYHTKKWGRKPLSYPIMIPDQVSLKPVVPVISDGDEQTLKFLSNTWNIFGNKPAFELSNRSHQEGDPWAEIYRNGSGKGQIIPKKLIAEKYKKNLRKKE